MHFTRPSPTKREIAIGRELASRYATQTRKLTPEEEGLEKYVTRIGGTGGQFHAHRHLPYTFTVLPDHKHDQPPFSLPGGPVYIGEGMLETDDDRR